MAKVLKTAAIVVGVAALAVVTGGAAAGLGISLATSVAGISASTLLLASGGLSVAAGLLAKHPTIPSSQTERLTASIDPGAFRKTVLGQTAMATDVRYEEWSGSNQDYCDWIVALASHAIDGVEEVWLNTDLAWSTTTGVTSKFSGYFSVPNIVLEGSPANAFTFGSGRWNAAAARLTGCAYMRLRFKVTGNTKKAESPFSGGPPSRITIIGRGAKLYDPRRDDTVPGGSGPMRWNDQSTWRYKTDDGVVIGENLPLQILYRVLGWRIRNPQTGEMKLAVGNGVPGRRVGMQSFQVAANLADELVNRSAGGQEPRYHGAGVVSEGDDNKTILDALCAGCCGRFRDTGGKLELVLAHNDLATAATDGGLNDDDVIGPFTWDPDSSLDQTPNVVRGKYIDPSTGSLYQSIDYPEARLPSPDGQDRFFPLDLGFVESPSQAQRVAKQVLERKQYQRRFTASFDIRAWKYPVGAVVPFTFAALGFNRKLFRVEEQELGQDGACVMTLVVETDQIYAWDANDSPPVLPADALVYDASNDPLILAIADVQASADEALTAAQAASTIAGDKAAIFYQSTPPSAAESQPNDQWINTAADNRAMIRATGSGRLAIGGNPITFGGDHVTLAWIEAPDQRIAAAIAGAAGAQATADGKVEAFFLRSASDPVPNGEGLGDLLFYLYATPIRIDHWNGTSWVASATYGATAEQVATIAASEQAIATIADDNVLSKGEKPQFVREWQQAQARYAAIDGKAAAFNDVGDQRAALTAAYTTLANAIGAIAPAYNDTTADSPISGTTLQTDWANFYTAYAALDMALTAQTISVQWSVDGATGWHDDFAAGDKYQRQSADGGTTWSAAIKVVGEDGSDGSDGANGTDGVNGQHTSFVFKRAAAQPNTPTSASTPPAGWSDAPPEQTTPPTALWQSQADFRDTTKLTAWAAPIKLTAADLADLDPDAANLLTEAKSIADGKNTIFRQATPPAASASQANDIWINTAAGNRTMQRVAGSGLLAIGASTITLGGLDLDLAWIEAPDAQLGQALDQLAAVVKQAAAAQSTADDAVTNIEALGDDAQLTPAEKKSVLIPQDGRLDGAWSTLDAQAADLGVTTERTAASTARNAWISYRNGLAPAWNDTSAATAVNRATLRSVLTSYENALTTLQKANTAAAAQRAEYDLITGSKPPTNADNTAENQVHVTPPSDLSISADYTGTPNAGQLPLTAVVRVARGSTDITTDASVTYAVSNISGSLAVTINNTAGDPNKGLITISQATAKGQFDLVVSVNGMPQPTMTIDVGFKTAAPPAGGGGSGTTSASQDMTSYGVSGSSFHALVTFPGMTVAAGKTIACHFNGSYERLAGSPLYSSVELKWQYKPSGGSTSTDMGAAVTGTSATYDSRGISGRTGGITCNQSVAPAAGTYDVSLVGMTDNGQQCSFDDGVASVSIA